MYRTPLPRCNRPNLLFSPPSPIRTFFTTRLALSKPRSSSALPPRPTVATSDLYKTYLKGSGPGGQKINKTSSAVQLTHLPTGIVVKSQETRSRTQNEKIARRILAEKVEVLEKGSEARVLVKQARESRKKRSGEKKRRRKYRKLEDMKRDEMGLDDAVEDGMDADVESIMPGKEEDGDRRLLSAERKSESYATSGTTNNG